MPEHRVAPVVEELIPVPDPVRCCELLSDLPYRLFLDSAAQGPRLGRYSFLTADPVAVVWSKGSRTECIDFYGLEGTRHAVDGDALDAIRTLLAPHAAEPVPGLPPFQGGAAGYLAYDWGRALERLPAPRHEDLALPDVVFGMYDWVLAWDHDESRAWLISTGLPETSPEARERRAAARAAEVREHLQSHHEVHADAPGAIAVAGMTLPLRPPPAPSFPVEDGRWDTSLALRSSFTHSGYLAAVARVREYIFAGDIFQANLSQRFEAPLDEPTWTLYRRLRTRNAAPFAAYLDFPDGVVLSASPERFLRVDIGGHVETRPIKGTRPRGFGPEHDSALGVALAVSAKDQAENLMIVDLMRNDLSRVCAPGTVRVPALLRAQAHPGVWHLVSDVRGTLAPGTGDAELIRATFPPGSVTGAPKVRALEVISELEATPREDYTGAVGYRSPVAGLELNVAIRTFEFGGGGRVWLGSGGGITAASDPHAEYRECLLKAAPLI